MKIVRSDREIGSVDVAIMLDTSPDNVNYMARSLSDLTRQPSLN
jgi:hypothetical protein